MSDNKVSGLEVVSFLVSLSPDHVYPPGGFSLNTVNLVKPVHASDNFRSSSAFQLSSICFSTNTFLDVSVVLVTSKNFGGIGNESSLSTNSLTLGST